jgi:hypothetical protein
METEKEGHKSNEDKEMTKKIMNYIYFIDFTGHESAIWYKSTKPISIDRARSICKEYGTFLKVESK